MPNDKPQATENYNDTKRWEKVPVMDITTPNPGDTVYKPSWWAVIDGCVLFYKARGHRSPQTNTNRAVIEHIRPDCTPIFLEQTYFRRSNP